MKSQAVQMRRRRPLAQPTEGCPAQIGGLHDDDYPSLGDHEYEIIHKVFEAVPSRDLIRYCVVVGAKDGQLVSGTDVLLREHSGGKGGWFGILFEPEVDLYARLKKHHKHLGNRCLKLDVVDDNGETRLVKILQKHVGELPAAFDCLNVNCTSSYWILNDLWRTGRFYPKLVSVPFHAAMPNDLVYIPKRKDRNGAYASLAALLTMAQHHGYELIAVCKTVAFFVQGPLYEECLKSRFPVTTIDEVRRRDFSDKDTGKITSVESIHHYHQEENRPISMHETSNSVEELSTEVSNVHVIEESVDVNRGLDDSDQHYFVHRQNLKKLPEPPGCKAEEMAKRKKITASFSTASVHKNNPSRETKHTANKINDTSTRTDCAQIPWLRRSKIRENKTTKSDTVEPFKISFRRRDCPSRRANDPPEARRDAPTSLPNTAKHSSIEDNDFDIFPSPSIDPPPSFEEQWIKQGDNFIYDGGKSRSGDTSCLNPPVVSKVSPPSSHRVGTMTSLDLADEDKSKYGEQSETNSFKGSQDKDYDATYEHTPISFVAPNSNGISIFSSRDDISAMLDSVLADLTLAGKNSDAETVASTESVEECTPEGGPARTFMSAAFLKKLSVDVSPCCVQKKNDISQRHHCGDLLTKQLRMKGYAIIRGTGISRFQCMDAMDACNSFLQEADELVRRSCFVAESTRLGYSPMLSEAPENSAIRDMVRRYRFSGGSNESGVWPDEVTWGEEASNYFREAVDEYRVASSRTATKLIDCISGYMSKTSPELRESMLALSDAQNFVEQSTVTLVGSRRGSRHISSHKALIPPRRDENMISLILIDNGDSAIFQIEEDDGTWHDATLPDVVPDDPIFLLHIGSQLCELSKGLFPSKRFRMIPASGTSPVNLITVSIKAVASTRLSTNSTKKIANERHGSVSEDISPVISPSDFESPKLVDMPDSSVRLEENVNTRLWNDLTFFQGLNDNDRIQMQNQIRKLEEWRKKRSDEEKPTQKEVTKEAGNINTFLSKLDQIKEANSRVLKKLGSIQEARSYSSLEWKLSASSSYDDCNSVEGLEREENIEISVDEIMRRFISSASTVEAIPSCPKEASLDNTRQKKACNEIDILASDDNSSNVLSHRTQRKFVVDGQRSDSLKKTERAKIKTELHNPSYQDRLNFLIQQKATSPLIHRTEQSSKRRDSRYEIPAQKEEREKKQLVVKSTLKKSRTKCKDLGSLLPKKIVVARGRRNILETQSLAGSLSKRVPSQKEIVSKFDNNTVRSTKSSGGHVSPPRNRSTSGYDQSECHPLKLEVWPATPGSPLRPIQVDEAPGSPLQPIPVRESERLLFPGLETNTTGHQSLQNIGSWERPIDVGKLSNGRKSTRAHDQNQGRIRPDPIEITDATMMFISSHISKDNSIDDRSIGKSVVPSNDQEENINESSTEQCSFAYEPRVHMKPHDPKKGSRDPPEGGPMLKNYEGENDQNFTASRSEESLDAVSFPTERHQWHPALQSQVEGNVAPSTLNESISRSQDGLEEGREVSCPIDPAPTRAMNALHRQQLIRGGVESKYVRMGKKYSYGYGAVIDDSSTLSHEGSRIRNGPEMEDGSQFRQSPENEEGLSRDNSNAVIDPWDEYDKYDEYESRDAMDPTIDMDEDYYTRSEEYDHPAKDDSVLRELNDGISHSSVPASRASSQRTEIRDNTKTQLLYPHSGSESSLSQNFDTISDSDEYRTSRSTERDRKSLQLLTKATSNSSANAFAPEIDPTFARARNRPNGCLPIASSRLSEHLHEGVKSLRSQQPLEEGRNVQDTVKESEDERASTPSSHLLNAKNASDQVLRKQKQKQVEKGTSPTELVIYNSWEQLSNGLKNVGPSSIASISEMTEDRRGAMAACLGDFGDNFQALHM